MNLFKKKKLKIKDKLILKKNRNLEDNKIKKEEIEEKIEEMKEILQLDFNCHFIYINKTITIIFLW